MKTKCQQGCGVNSISHSLLVGVKIGSKAFFWYLLVCVFLSFTFNFAVWLCFRCVYGKQHIAEFFPHLTNFCPLIGKTFPFILFYLLMHLASFPPSFNLCILCVLCFLVVFLVVISCLLLFLFLFESVQISPVFPNTHSIYFFLLG